MVFNLDRNETPVDGPVGAGCPDDYADALPGRRDVPLKLVIAAHPAYDHIQQCRADRVGRTHLFAPRTDDDVEQAIALLTEKGLDEPLFFVGGLQRRNADGAAVGWVRITGGDLPSQWHAGEPDDGGVAERHLEDIAALWANPDPDGMLDVDPGQSLYAICACDDEQVTAQALDIIEGFEH